MDRIEAQFKQFDAMFKNHKASIRNIETQLGQISQQLAERPEGTLPSNIVKNPREQVKAITLRSRKKLGEPKKPKAEEEPSAQTEVQTAKGKKYEIPMRHSKDVGEDEKSPEYVAPPADDPPIPYPHRVKQLKKEQQDKQFAKFLEVFKKLQINIPFVGALTQMPSYPKFMKEILSQKRKIRDDETVLLIEECSAILHNKLPSKLKDPGSFTIPYVISDVYFNKALCDIGASINLMPLSNFRKPGVKEVKPTTMSLQSADRSIKHPRGIIEDVLVKVDKLIFLVDFVVHGGRQGSPLHSWQAFPSHRESSDRCPRGRDRVAGTR